MWPRWINLKEMDRIAYRATASFLNGRLEEQSTVNWALRLNHDDPIKRLAVLDLIDSPDGRKIREPWRSAWRLIEESWSHPTDEDPASIGAYHVQHRLRSGDRSGSLVTAIADLVSPRLEVEPFSSLHPYFRQPPRRPKRVEDLFKTGLTCWEIVDPGILELKNLTDGTFLGYLARALDTAVADGLDIARRIGWCGEGNLWQLGGLHRVYFVPVTERAGDEHEPDAFNKGIAPSVKLLHAVVSRLSDIDLPAAIDFVRRWKLIDSPIHVRLWTALSFDSRISSPSEVGSFLLSLDQHRFWDLHGYPEIAELRAKRFGELEPHEQAELTARLRKLPPRSHWRKSDDRERVKSARLYWAVRELRRIEIAGGALLPREKGWLRDRIYQFPDLIQMARLDEGFLGSPRVRSIPPNPDSRYDMLSGEERLMALEADLSSAHRGWDDDPAACAADWIREPLNSLQVLSDLESLPNAGAAFSRVWQKFGWAHSPGMGQTENHARRDLIAESARVLSLLAKLPVATIRHAIDGVAHWLSAWERQVVVAAEGLGVWLRLWPIAVKATNEEQPVDDEVRLSTVEQSPDDKQLTDIEALNTPAGKLVGVFLAACPDLQVNSHPFDIDGDPRSMRDAIIAATGRSGLIARHRMIEYLPYFLNAAPDWTHKHLITPLIADNPETIALWRAIARRTLFSNVLKIIGGAMAERATDLRLDRESRCSLVLSLVVESLYALWEQRDPSVPYARIQQMIRSLDDEVRAYGADTVQRFINEVSVSRNGGQTSPSPEQLFQAAARPFLEKVWPQERSLATPGVSRALADLPATTKEAFAEAVGSIDRFLVPFECWSMSEYGFRGEGDGEPKLSVIDNQEKAAAFLRLLDLTIGIAEGSVIPYDLSDALDQIHKVAPSLAESKGFRRLATAARRSLR